MRKSFAGLGSFYALFRPPHENRPLLVDGFVIFNMYVPMNEECFLWGFRTMLGHTTNIKF